MLGVSRIVGACVLPVSALWADVAWADGAPRYRRVGWSDWNLDPVMLTLLATAAWLYFCGTLRVWERAGVGHVISRGQAFAVGAGLFTLAIAILSPLDALGEQLASAHMIQHMLLSTVAAPLLVAGSAWWGVLWGVDDATRQRWRKWIVFWRALPVAPLLWQPLAVAGIYVAVLWLWHYPLFYEAALHNRYLHDLQHFTFFVTAMLFWRLALERFSRQRLPAGLAILLMFAATMQAILLGVFMTLAPMPWYPTYAGSAALWGLTALEDQQLAGLIMWMPACTGYLLAALFLFAKLIQEPAPCRHLLKSTRTIEAMS